MHNQVTGFKQLVEQSECQKALGVFDGFSALVAARAGARVLHASGGAISRSIGFMDIGLVTMTEMLGRIDEIVTASEAMVIADADTGYGNELNAERTAKELSKCGVVALHIEDQTYPKRCGHMDGVSVIDVDEMCSKIKAVKDAVGDDLVVIARTDALGLEGMQATIDRMGQYLESGGDLAFVEGIQTEDELTAVASGLKAKLLVNHARASSGDVFSDHVLMENDVKVAIYPGDLQRAAIFAMDQVAREIISVGSSMKYQGAMFSYNDRDGMFENTPN